MGVRGWKTNAGTFGRDPRQRPYYGVRTSLVVVNELNRWRRGLLPASISAASCHASLSYPSLQEGLASESRHSWCEQSPYETQAVPQILVKQVHK